MEEICKMANEAGLCLKAAYGDYVPYHYDEASMFMNLLFTRKKGEEIQFLTGKTGKYPWIFLSDRYFQWLINEYDE